MGQIPCTCYQCSHTFFFFFCFATNWKWKSFFFLHNDDSPTSLIFMFSYLWFIITVMYDAFYRPILLLDSIIWNTSINYNDEFISNHSGTLSFIFVRPSICVFISNWAFKLIAISSMEIVRATKWNLQFKIQFWYSVL